MIEGSIKYQLKEQDIHDLAALRSALEKLTVKWAALSPACRVDLTGRLLGEGPRSEEHTLNSSHAA